MLDISAAIRNAVSEKTAEIQNLPISLKMSSTKRVWHNVVGAIKAAGVRILKLFVRILQTQ
jgi:hypothetical protein